jgi:hypothetical protein
MRSLKKRPPVVTAALQERQAAYARLPARHVILTRYGLRAAGALERAGQSPPCLRYRSHKLVRDAPTPQPMGSAASQGLARTRSWPRVIAAAIAAVAGMPSKCNAIPAGQNQAGPLHV